MVLAAPLLTLKKGVVLGRYSKAGKYLLKILLCRRIARELMLSVTLKVTLNKASLSLSLIGIKTKDTRYKKLYLKSAFNFNISKHFTDKKSERLYKYKTYNKSQENWVNITEFTLLQHRYLYIKIICKIKSYKDKKN